MRLCTIDVGTNTVNSLVADVDEAGGLRVVAAEDRFARLGQGVDAERRLAPEAMNRVVRCLAAALETARAHGAERVVIGATSASRDARNADVLVARVRDELGLAYRILSGEEEAALSFRGALATLPGVPAAVLLDIGGGSTEIVVGARPEAGVPPALRASVDVGSVRLTERCFGTRPVPAPDAASARALVARLLGEALARLPEEARARLPVVVTGSVARVFARLAGPLAAHGPEGLRVPAAAVCAWRDRLLALTPAEALAAAPDVLAGREDIAAAAALILAEGLEALGAGHYVVSPGGLRHGLALAAAAGEI